MLYPSSCLALVLSLPLPKLSEYLRAGLSLAGDGAGLELAPLPPLLQGGSSMAPTNDNAVVASALLRTCGLR